MILPLFRRTRVMARAAAFVPYMRELQALTRPAFDLSAHLARSAEVSAFDLAGHIRQRQPINMVRTTCAKLRRPLDEARERV